MGNSRSYVVESLAWLLACLCFPLHVSANGGGGADLHFAQGLDSAEVPGVRAPRAGRPRIGLALSGGGAKGFAHIGALKVIEELGLPIDFISGTSMGSIVGGLYSIGYSLDELEQIAMTTDWPHLFSDARSRRELPIEQKLVQDRYIVSLPLVGRGVGLPRGLVAGQRISTLFNRLTLSVHDENDFSQFPIPFVCVASDIETGQPVVLDHGFLPEAIRASMAIPSVFTPVEIDDRLLVDGMLVRNFPVQEVIDMGADIVIGVDVGAPLATREKLTSFISIMGQAMGFMGAESTTEQRGLTDVLILPDIENVSATDFDRMRQIIDSGEEAARRALPQLQALIDSLGLAHEEYRSPGRASADYQVGASDVVEVSVVQVEGLDLVHKKVVLNEFGIAPPFAATVEEVELAIRRVYNTGFFERVTYKLGAEGGERSLTIRVIEKEDDYLRFGLRYDSHTELSAVFNLLFNNALGKSSILNLDLVTGQRNHIDARYILHPGLKQRVALGSRVAYADDFIDFYQDETQVAELAVEAFLGELIVGTTLSTEFLFGLGLRAERVRVSPDIGGLELLDIDEDLGVLVGVIWFDSLDRGEMPRQGFSVFVRTDYAPDAFTKDESFGRYFGKMRAAVPVMDRVTLYGEVVAGTTSGDDPPPHYQFILGGIDTPTLLLERDLSKTSFVGLRSQELLGRHAQFAQVGIQFGLTEKLLLLLRANAGNTFDKWDLDLSSERFESGVGATLGLLSPFGPVALSGTYGSTDDFISYFSFGRTF